MLGREFMSVVIVGHVDHGKSTVIGRLLADSGSLPEGKLEQVQATCARHAKPFEYAFLLDALKDEQTQGITIDTARCFLKTAKRDYIILDAPGHVEFLKNMVTGASRAEAALLVIDAQQGIQENTKRHGILVSMLGIKQIIVLVNKMDLVNFSQDIFAQLSAAYNRFLSELDVKPLCFIPISAWQGDNLLKSSNRMPWYPGPSLLQELEELPVKGPAGHLPLRFPVQDIYKFTEDQDNRRIIAGTIETGEIHVGTEVVFFPSQKKSRIKTIEEFNAPPRETAASGESLGVTLQDDLYLRPGEIMTSPGNPPPKINSRFKANLFWVGQAPLLKNKTYKIKLGTAQSPVKLVDIIRVLDAEDLSANNRQEIVNRHDVATCILEATRPLAYDLAQDIETLSRFVIVDHFEIAGGGIIIEELPATISTLEKHVQTREKLWVRSLVQPSERTAAYKHPGKFIVITGNSGDRKEQQIAQLLEKKLFDDGYKAYYLNMENLRYGLGDETVDIPDRNEEEIRLLGELGRVLTDAGQILITDLTQYDTYDIEKLKTFSRPFEILIVGVDDSTNVDIDAQIRVSKTWHLADTVSQIYQLLKSKAL